MKKHLADHFEAIARIIPDEVAISHHGVNRSWRELADRAARIASALATAVGPNDKVAIFSRNSNEYIEAHLAILKIRGVPINVNHRYVESELRYLLDDADVKAVVFQARFAPVLQAIKDSLPRLRHFIEIDDASGEHLANALDYEAVIAANPAMPPVNRSGGDSYIVYTGGTTGAPKGVVYRMEDFYTRQMRTFEMRGLSRPHNEDELRDVILGLRDSGGLPRALAACPLMHGTGLYLGVLFPHLVGGQVITVDTPRFDAHALWQAAQTHAATELTLVGDAFAAPMVAALRDDAARGAPYNLGALRIIYSSGVIFSSESKQALLEYCDATIYDALGSTEGSYGWDISSRTNPPGSTARFKANDTTKVFAPDDREIVPGSGEIGALACGGIVPLEYYKDPEKSAKTFRMIDGRRYAFPGDMATIAQDGTLVLLGRGSNCINTGGEKVFPEEVEEAFKALPAVRDCLVIGEPDERMGQRVVAVVSFEPGCERDPISLIDEVRGRIAAYKLPRTLVAAAEIPRHANGKPDYRGLRDLLRASTLPA